MGRGEEGRGRRMSSCTWLRFALPYPSKPIQSGHGWQIEGRGAAKAKAKAKATAVKASSPASPAPKAAEAMKAKKEPNEEEQETRQSLVPAAPGRKVSVLPDAVSRVRFSRWLGAQKDYTHLFTTLDRSQQEEVKKQFLVSPSMAKNTLEMTCTSSRSTSASKKDHWFTAQQVAQAEGFTNASEPYVKSLIEGLESRPSRHSHMAADPSAREYFYQDAHRAEFKSMSTVTTAANSKVDIKEASEALWGHFNTWVMSCENHTCKIVGQIATLVQTTHVR